MKNNEKLASKWQEIEDHTKKYHQEIYNHPLFRDVANDERYGLVPYVLYASDSQVAVVLIKDGFIKYAICATKDIGTMNGLIFICIQNNLNDQDEKILSYLNGFGSGYSAGSYETSERRNSQHR